MNLKAQFYQELADAFERGQVEGLTDEATFGQLAGLLYEIDSQGRLKIESKEQARARGVLSPDRADALMLALCKPPVEWHHESVRDLERRRSNSHERLVGGYALNGFGFKEVPDDRDDIDKRDPWRGWVGKIRWSGRGRTW